MKSSSLFVISALAAAVSSFAAEPGSVTRPTTPPVPPAPPPVNAAPGTGPQVSGVFRFVKPDGMNVITQDVISTGTSAITTLTMSGADAISSGSGRCAFNVKYDEISSVVATNTTNRLYSNDALIAQNTKLDLEPNKLKTVWTQPYLFAGLNNIRIVINADGAKPSTGWIRVNVTGSCGGVTAPAPAPAPKPPEPPKATTPSLATTPPATTQSKTPEPPKTTTSPPAAPPKATEPAKPTTPPMSTPPKTPEPPKPATDPKVSTPPTGTTPPVTPKPPVVVEVKYAPGSSQWTQLYTAYGYSNYGVTQLKGKGYPRYTDREDQRSDHRGRQREDGDAERL